MVDTDNKNIVGADKILPYQKIETTYSPYDKNAPYVFKKLKKIILFNILDARIEHTGSTAIGIHGKKIINIIFLEKTNNHSRLIKNLIRIGFQLSPFTSVPKGIPFLGCGVMYRRKKYTIHAHILTIGCDDHKNIIFFRDYLKKNKKDIVEYEQLKKEAIALGKLDSKSYNDHKSPFIKKIISKRKN